MHGETSAVTVRIKAAAPSDAAAIAAIYNHYVLHSIATFEEEPLADEQMQTRIEATFQNQLPYLVAISGEEIVGYAYASKWNGRCAYKFSVEVTVYLVHDRGGAGLGTMLYEALFEQLRQRGYHVAIAGISLPNSSSVALHEKFGMKKVAHFAEVGHKFGDWIDVGYWQVILA